MRKKRKSKGIIKMCTFNAACTTLLTRVCCPTLVAFCATILFLLTQYATQTVLATTQSTQTITSQQQQQQILTELVHAATNTSSKATNQQFVIKFIHNDPQNNLAYVNIERVNYTNLHEPRIQLRYNVVTNKSPYVQIDEKASNGTVVAAVVTTDEDPGPSGEISLSIESGNELNHFKLSSTPNSNFIQVNGAPLNSQRVAEYNLTILARDHGSPPRQSTANLVIKLSNTQSSSSPYILDPSPMQTLPSDLMYIGAVLVSVFFAVVLFIIIACAIVQSPRRKKDNRPRFCSDAI